MAHPDPIDVDMSGTQPPDRPRGYNVPCPPMMPLVDDQGDLIYDHWSDVHEKYTTKLSDDGTWFEVRELNENDPTGMARRYEGDWPKKYPLGPPSKTPDYHPIHEKYGLKVLNAAGFINSTKPYESAIIGPNGKLHGEWYRNPKSDLDQRIHPVFRFDMWRGITRADYDMLDSPLLLASAILDDPTTLNYFYAVMQQADTMDTVIDPDTNATCKVVDVPDTLTPEQQYATHSAICAMRNYTSFNLNWSSVGSDYAPFAETVPLFDHFINTMPAARPNTRQSTVNIDRNYLKLLKTNIDLLSSNHATTVNTFSDIQRTANIPASSRENIDLLSSYHRIVLLFTNTLLHEFVHAFVNAYFDIPDVLTQPREPWLRGTRCNEQGYTFENFIFGGLPRAMAMVFPPMSHQYEQQQYMQAPFGAYFTSQWDQWLKNPGDNSYVMPSVHKDQVDEPMRLYPIPQEWFQRVLEDDMWLKQVWRFGIRALQMPKCELWMVMFWKGSVDDRRGIWGTGEERWNRPDDLTFVEGVKKWV